MPAPAIDGPRACTRAELPEVIALVDAAMRQNSDQSMLTDYPLVYQDDNLANIRILKVNGELASVVPFIPWSVTSFEGGFTLGIISPTATAPQHRKKGYGLRCLNDCIHTMEQAHCLLSTLWTLPATFPFYQHADYQAIPSPGWIYHLAKSNAALCRDNGEKIVALRPSMTRILHQIALRPMRQRYALFRSIDRLAALLQLPKMQTLVALQGDEVAAYLVFSRATHKPGIVEARGDHRAIETLMRRALSTLEDGATCQAYTYRIRSSLRWLLRTKFPGRRTPMPAGQMMRIHKPHEFLVEIGHWLLRKNRGVRRAFSLEIDGEITSFEFDTTGLGFHHRRMKDHFKLSRRELVSLVFGVHPAEHFKVPPALAGLFPFYLPIRMLDRS